MAKSDERDRVGKRRASELETAEEIAPEPQGGPIPVAPISVSPVSVRPRRTTTPKSRTPSVKSKAAGVSGPKSTRMPASTRSPASSRMPASSRIPASTRVPSRKSSVTSSKGAGASSSTGAPSVRAKTAPRSLRAPVRDDATIPPTWSDVDERGDAVATAHAGSIPPAPIAPKIALPAEELAPVKLPVTGSWLSPVLKGAVGIAAAVAIVFLGRGFVRHAPTPVAAASPAPAVAEAVIPPPADVAPADPNLAPAPADTAATESAADAKHAALTALEQRKLDDAIAAGEQATTLDPADADSWLVLGAAYQDQGKFADAQRCFKACVTQATRGEVRECKFLMH